MGLGLFSSLLVDVSRRVCWCRGGVAFALFLLGRARRPNKAA